MGGSGEAAYLRAAQEGNHDGRSRPHPGGGYSGPGSSGEKELAREARQERRGGQREIPP